MSEENPQRRFKGNAASGKQLLPENSVKEFKSEGGGIYNLTEFDGDTRRHVEDMKSGGSNILVAVRVRPLNSKEHSISNFETIRVLDSKIIVLLDPQNEFEPEDVFRNNRNRERQYAFDFAFDKDTSTETIFHKTTAFLIDGVLNGYNATVFAYGATGAGKTYTMMGHGEGPGIMDLTLTELFQEVERLSANKEYSIKVSYLEVYNETIRDLLSSEDTNLDLREDPLRGNCVAGITEIITSSTSEVMAMLKIGNKNRTMEATGANQVSSRSHAVLQVVVEHKDKNQGVVEELTIGKLSLVDLAGSERAANTNNRGIRMIEGANINKSLLALGNCITMLSDQSEKSGRTNHIPYRDSKLTRLLKDSLGGNCRTVMIANVTPSAASFEDTHNTLKYANRAKNIKTNASRNVLEVSNHIAKYTQIISSLKNENEVLRRQIQDPKFKHPIEHSGGGSVGPANERVQAEIHEHFEREMAIKKKIYEIEDQMDTVGHQIYRALAEMKNPDDKATRDRYEAFKQAQKDMAAKLENLHMEYNGVYSKRNAILLEINGERRESMNYLTSLFKQFQFTMENMEFQHREKKSDGHIKGKDLQIIHLQSQLLLRDEILKDQRSLLENNKIKSNINYNKIKSIYDIEEEAKLALPIQKGSSLPPKQFSTPGRMRGNDFAQSNTNSLPIIHRSLPSNMSNLLRGKNRMKVSVRTRNPTNDSIDSTTHRKNRSNGGSTIPSPTPNNNYYFNKQVMYKYRYDKPTIAVRPKKRVAYLPPIELTNREPGAGLPIEKGPRGFQTQRKVPGGLNRSLDASPRRRSGSLSDVSYMSTASSSSQKAKNRILAEKNQMRQSVPEVMKEKALHPQAHIPLRYNESPYVNKLKNDKQKRNQGESSTDRLSQLASNQLRGKSVSPTPTSLQRNKSQKRDSKFK